MIIRKRAREEEKGAGGGGGGRGLQMVRWLVVRVTSIASLLQRCLLVRYPLEQNGPKLLFHSDGGSSGNVTRTN